MVRWIWAVLLAAICVVVLGCANVESSPPGSTDQPVRMPLAPVAEETEAPVDANLAVTEVNEPPATTVETPDANDAPIAEPNVVTAEPQVETPVPAAAEPNVVVVRTTAFDARCAAILATYVRENGLVDYGDLRRHRLELKSVLTILDELDPNVYESWSQPRKLAFWINAYNLKMLDVIARNYPIESSWWLRLTWPPNDIRHIQGIWTDYRFIVMDEEFTLTEVEQRFFHRTFDDPRVWLALDYATQSGPPLRNEPYGPAGLERGGSGPYSSTKSSDDPPGRDLDRQLDEQVRRFLSSPRGLQIDRENGVVRLSALFKPSWRGKEFVARYGTDKKFKGRDPATRAVLSFITNYLPREDVEFLEVENYSIEYLNFDWRLNDTAKGY